MKYLLLSLLIGTNISLFAQLSGEITYTTKINMHKNLPNDERGDMMRQFVPEFMELKNKLLFTSTETLYSNIQEEETAESNFDEAEQRQKRMMRRMAPPNNTIYCNIDRKQIIRKQEFMDKVFLIKDSIDDTRWKLTGEMKALGGMNCMKAVYIPDAGDSTKIEVWFTPEIPVSSGPAGYGGLPGLIVHVNENDGQKVISMSSLVMREVKAEEIEEPKKGKVMTQEEYTEMVVKKMEQMRKQWEGQGGGPPPPMRPKR